MNKMNKTMTALFAAALLSVAACSTAVGQPVPSQANWRGMAELEQIGISEGLTVTEIESKQRLAEVEGYDAQSRKVKLIVDRQTGEVLSRRVKERRGR